MLLQLSLLHFIFFILPTAFSSLIAKPGCPERCGSLSIPYPFGIGSNCSRHQLYDITCNNSTVPPKAYLSNISTEVVEITQSFVRVKYPNLAKACYNLSDYHQDRINIIEKNDTVIDLSGTRFTLSDQNWLTGIGCDVMATGSGVANTSFVAAACVSFCRYENGSGNKVSCRDNGNGCCQSPIPRGTRYLEVSLSHINWKWRSSKLFNCNYAFVVDQSGFAYPSHSLAATSAPLLVLDWRIGAINCSKARNNSTSFACQDNSVCVDSDAKVVGYHCHCLEGYEGNPYLAPGCIDIDECATPRNPCHSICSNTVGSFSCSCPKWYFGDGRKNGTGCRRLPPSKTINALIGFGSGMGFLLLLSMCFWFHKVLQNKKNKLRKEKFFKRNGGLLFQQQTTNEGTFGRAKLFPAKDLEKATDHFNENRILGQGGHGTVYKGMLSDGKIVAIKKSKLVDEDQSEQFINEVVILSQINHRNVINLLGCCLETEVPLLVYEFVPNGTLSDLIHDPTPEFPVSWNMRLKIAADIAGALAYLHSASSLPIYHRDIKSSNILLDEKYVVKVSDFGTSKCVAADQTHLTTLVKGTFGYLDPEYFQSSQFTEKSDVYSFGVVLVELLTGQRAMSLNRTEEERSLATRFLASMEENNLDTILDPQVSEHGRKEEVIAVARLAQRCLNLKGKMRPTMKEVATELESFRISQMPSNVKDEIEEARVYEAKPMMISDIEYTWTTSGNSENSSSSDTRPLMFATS